MNSADIRKSDKNIFKDKEEHLKVSRLALVMSLIPLLNQLAVLFKMNYMMSHILGAINVICTLGGFIFSFLCIRNHENRNMMNFVSLVISGFFLLVTAVIIIMAIIFTITHK